VNVPDIFMLEQNYPNPFNPQTEICYSVPAGSNVNLTVFDILGRKVRVLADGWETPGMKLVTWDGRDDRGVKVSSGIYFYRLQADDFVETKKMILSK
jgi:flagellar hook assembly protein FlgD